MVAFGAVREPPVPGAAGKLEETVMEKGTGALSPKVRVASVGDAAALAAIYAPYVEQTAITFEYEAPDAAGFARRIARTLERYPYLVAELPGEDAALRPVGYAYAGPFKERAAYDWAAETSIYVERGLLHRGIGRALHDALEGALREQGIVNMCACITVPSGGPDERADFNSRDFHAHLGYRQVGEFHMCGYKFGRWYDMVWMEKMLGAHLDEGHGGQPAVVPFVQLARGGWRPGWVACYSG